MCQALDIQASSTRSEILAVRAPFNFAIQGVDKHNLLARFNSVRGLGGKGEKLWDHYSIAENTHFITEAYLEQNIIS